MLAFQPIASAALASLIKADGNSVVETCFANTTQTNTAIVSSACNEAGSASESISAEKVYVNSVSDVLVANDNIASNENTTRSATEICSAVDSLTASLLWEPVTPTTEIWTNINNSTATWTIVSDSSATWTAIPDNTDIWTPVTNSDDIWTKAA